MIEHEDGFRTAPRSINDLPPTSYPGHKMVYLYEYPAAVLPQAGEAKHVLTEQELADPEYMKAYVDEMQATISELLIKLAAPASLGEAK